MEPGKNASSSCASRLRDASVGMQERLRAHPEQGRWEAKRHEGSTTTNGTDTMMLTGLTLALASDSAIPCMMEQRIFPWDTMTAFPIVNNGTCNPLATKTDLSATHLYRLRIPGKRWCPWALYVPFLPGSPLFRRLE